MDLPIKYYNIGSYNIKGMPQLMLFQFIYNLIAWGLLFVFMQDKPPSPPSMSTKMKHDLEDSQRSQLSQETTVNQTTNTPTASTAANSASSSQKTTQAKIWEDVRLLLNNRNYVVLWICFAIAVGVFNGLLTVVNQFVGAVGYTYVVSYTYIFLKDIVILLTKNIVLFVANTEIVMLDLLLPFLLYLGSWERLPVVSPLIVLQPYTAIFDIYDIYVFLFYKT